MRRNRPTKQPRFLSPLITKYVKPGWSRVTEPLDYRSTIISDIITVPAGFEFDWDSVPRFPFVHALLKGRAEKSACLHDWLYYNQMVDRKVSDLIFWEAMKVEGVALAYRMLIYVGVRLGGGRSWRRHATD